jgi:hypothetical protein
LVVSTARSPLEKRPFAKTDDAWVFIVSFILSALLHEVIDRGATRSPEITGISRLGPSRAQELVRDYVTTRPDGWPSELKTIHSYVHSHFAGYKNTMKHPADSPLAKRYQLPGFSMYLLFPQKTH